MKKILIVLFMVAIWLFAPKYHTETVTVVDCTSHIITVATEDGDIYRIAGQTDRKNLTAVFEDGILIGFEEKVF